MLLDFVRRSSCSDESNFFQKAFLFRFRRRPVVVIIPAAVRRGFCQVTEQAGDNLESQRRDSERDTNKSGKTTEAQSVSASRSERAAIHIDGPDWACNTLYKAPDMYDCEPMDRMEAGANSSFHF